MINAHFLLQASMAGAGYKKLDAMIETVQEERSGQFAMLYMPYCMLLKPVIIGLT